MNDRFRAMVRTLVALIMALSGLAVVTPVPPASAATRYRDPMFDFTLERDVTYAQAARYDGTTQTLTLDIYRPKDDTATRRPVVVLAHGGGFYDGNKDQVGQFAADFAKRGYLAISIAYRLGPNFVGVSQDAGQAAQVQRAVDDMKASVKWVRANAVALGADPDRIAVGGVSSGAVMAVATATNGDLPSPVGLPNVSTAVCAAVSVMGTGNPARIDPTDAPVIFHHGDQDTVVPYSLANQMYNGMVAAGVPSEFFTYAGLGHDLSPFATQILDRSVDFLYRRLVTSPHPCSPAVGIESRVRAGSQTVVHGLANRSAIVSIVATETAGPGYIQVLPCGATPGTSSNLNIDAVNQTRAGLAVVRFDAVGTVCLYNQSVTHLVVDVQAYISDAAIDDITDTRLLDSRLGNAPVVPGGTQTPIAGRPNSTAIISLVASDTTGPGYIQVLPCGATPGTSSNLNVDGANQVRSGLAVVRFGASGTVCLYNQTATHLVVDIQGYIADTAIDDVTDDRLLDSRLGNAPVVPGGTQTPITGRPNSTAIVSLVATDTTGPGYIQVLPCGTTPGTSANLNADRAGQIIANLAVVRFGAAGTVCLYNQTATHLVVDVQGYIADAAIDDIPDDRLLDTRLPFLDR